MKLVLADTNADILAEWRRAFEDRPEVQVAERSVLDVEASAWVVETKRGDLAEPVRAALGEAVEGRLRAGIRESFGGSLPADFAYTVPTDGDNPRFVIAVSNGARNPHGVDDPLRVALAAGAALQAVHKHNARAAGSIASIALPPVGPASVPARARAELMWTAYALFREAEMPDFATMRRALMGLLVGVDPEDGPGAYKRSFGTRASRDSVKSTLPDRHAATAQLRRRLDDAEES